MQIIYTTVGNSSDGFTPTLKVVMDGQPTREYQVGGEALSEEAAESTALAAYNELVTHISLALEALSSGETL